MENRELLLDLAKEIEITGELSDKVTKYFKEKNIPMDIIMKKYRRLIEGNLDLLTDEEVNDLIPIFGGKPQVEENKDINKKEVNKTEDENENKSLINNNFIDSHNDLVIKNQELETELKEKIETVEELELKSLKLEEKVEELQTQMDKFSHLSKLLEKFNITDIGQFVEVEKAVVNEAYLVYITENKTEHKNTFIIKNENDGTINVVNSYYTTKK